MRNLIVVTASALLATFGFGCAAKRVVATDEPKELTATPPAKTPVKQAEISASAEDSKPLAKFDGATLFFEFNSSQLTAESLQTLRSLAEVMRDNKAVRVNVAGHCDERGTTEFNLALGNSRAEAAKKYLVALGVEESRVSTISYGEESPAQVGSNEDAYAANRRDVIVPQQ